MDIVFGVIIGLIVITILVVIHELGHALVARRNGVVVEEFGIGFPPKVWAKKIKHSILGKNVRLSINALPLGGFVKLQGEHDTDDGPGDYGSATLWQKTKILLAGVAMNWITAVVLFSILASIGMPRLFENQFSIAADTQIVRKPVEIVTVVGGSPAEKAGLQQGDKILRFAGAPLEGAEDLTRLALENKGKTIETIYSRNDVEHSTKVTLRANNSDKRGYLGATSAQQELIKASWSAPIVGVGTTVQMTWETFKALGGMLYKGITGLALQFSPNETTREAAQRDLQVVGDSVAGPVGIFGIIFPAAGKAGGTHVLMLSAIISLTLAVMNMLPIPALDGGRWAVTMLFRLLKKPLKPELEERIHGTGFMLLMVLIVLITISDIGKL